MSDSTPTPPAPDNATLRKTMRFLWLRKQGHQFAAFAIRRQMRFLQTLLDYSLSEAALYKRRMEREKRTNPSAFPSEVQDWEHEGEGWKDSTS